MPLDCTRHEDPFHCPPKWELWRAILALLPPGRAWQRGPEDVHDIVFNTESSEVGPFEVGVSGLGVEPAVERLTVMQQFWAAYAEVLAFVHARACALLEEFFCSTTAELRNEWGIDYGFPDPCEPFHTLCEKVAATGGASCAFLVETAAAIGWIIDCQEDGLNELTLTIDPASPAYVAPAKTLAQVGRARVGGTTMCPPDILALVCIIERFKQAHVKITYVVGA